jgi:5-methylcytosine-specific restriction endonuclease McrA
MSLLYQNNAKALDKDFIPYNFEDWLEYSQYPEVLDDGYAMINTVKHKIAIPDIIVLREYASIPKRDIKYSRENVFHRDANICQYCGKRFKRNELTIDHVVPKSIGGGNTWDNIVAACVPCNAYKADRTPEQAGMKLLSRPKEPRWQGAISKAAARPDIRPSWKKFLKGIGI